MMQRHLKTLFGVLHAECGRIGGQVSFHYFQANDGM
jgi:hypothetical protein